MTETDVDGMEFPDYTCGLCGSKEASGECFRAGEPNHEECEFSCDSCGSRNVGGRCLQEFHITFEVMAGPAIALDGGSTRAIDMMSERGLMGLVGEIVLGWAQVEYNLWKILPEGNRPDKDVPFKKEKARWRDDLQTLRDYAHGMHPLLHPHIERLVVLDKEYTRKRHAIAHGALSVASRNLVVIKSGGKNPPDQSLPAHLYLLVGEGEDEIKVGLDEESLGSIAGGIRKMLDVLAEIQRIAQGLALQREAEWYGSTPSNPEDLEEGSHPV